MNADPCLDVRVGLDLGGTGTRAVAISGGAVIDVADALTADLGDGPIPVRMDRLATLVRTVVPPAGRLVGVGVGASGPVDVRTGVIDNCDTLPWFSGFEFSDGLRERLDVPVTIDNDAVAAALGEYGMGAGNGCDRVMMVTLGTGVGVAMLIDGQPLRGRDGAHPEGGHIPVLDSPTRCYCGLTGCWEPAASRHTLQRMVGQAMGSRPSSSGLLAEAAAAASSQSAVANAFTAYGGAVGRGLAALHGLYQPRVTVIGGSAAACFTHFEAGMNEALCRAPSFDVSVDIRPAQLGDTAGAIGAALMITPLRDATDD